MRAEQRLGAVLAVGAPAAEARWMVEQASGYESDELVAYESEVATARAADHLEAMMARREAGEPLQYVLGAWPFLGLDLIVDRRVLIPRAETEVTAGIAIEEAARLGARRGAAVPWSSPADTAYAVADLGTGCGAIALALAAELPDAMVWATDVSEAALAVAGANLAGAGLPATRVRLAGGDWFEALPPDLEGALRVIVANPPYVAELEWADLPETVAAYEPRDALVAGPTGLEAIEMLVRVAPSWLEPDGVLVCELAPHQAGAAGRLARDAGFADWEIRADLTSRDRVLVARRNAAQGASDCGAGILRRSERRRYQGPQ